MAVAESEIELFGAKLGFKFFYNAFSTSNLGNLGRVSPSPYYEF